MTTSPADATSGTPNPPTGEEFIEAFHKGQIGDARKILRQLDRLDKPQLDELADILDDDVKLQNFNPWKLVLKRRTAGKPSDPLDRRVRDTNLGRRVSVLLAKGMKVEAKSMKVEAALQIIADEQGLSLTTVKNAYRAYKRRSGHPSSN